MSDVSSESIDRVDWVVVVPVKRLDRAKTRLSSRPAPARRELSLAFALDTVAAALAAEHVRAVVVVSDDDDVRPAIESLGARFLPDESGGGLNPALAVAAHALSRSDPGLGIAVLVGDLPALRPHELARALAAAAGVRRGLVSDSAGTGTTLLCAAPGIGLEPGFGVRSRAVHIASGAIELAPGVVPGLRRDVDNEVDLWDADRLGLGPATTAALSGD